MCVFFVSLILTFKLYFQLDIMIKNIRSYDYLYGTSLIQIHPP